MPLVDKLFDGPVDIIGDIHGEIGSLCQLLFRLGYDGKGRHAEGRRLVFLGDLVDRGPDSPAVVRLVRSLVESGAAQMVLGNHEINLLRRARKHGNHWFWGETEQLCNTSPDAKPGITSPDTASFQVLEDPERQEEYLRFFRGLPLVLERPGVTVLHAMYHRESIDALRANASDAGVAHDAYDEALQQRLAEMQASGQNPTKDEVDMLMQNENPVKVVTTGMEVPAAEPFFAGGKLRSLERFRWWEKYDGQAGLVVVGHYWRRRPASVDVGIDLTGPSVFPSEASAPGAELAALGTLLEEPPEGIAWAPGAKRAVACIDYSVGLRFEERGRGLPEGSLGTALAALRLPEGSLYFADGEVHELA
eukprot:CAMPEP_0179074128 /NCGR_PEP_ID=MMETSP0796-20121207/32926_1 /TAXON_ID=73915 /ORGANISM="Pyrodinium bahamense, Strain pbaha01" /LENGTH=362 /DNA_ID=CAMNT_0020771341 /DNA_START=67 /DNA_END=1152 /DNA_ORIENTATION=-